MSLVIFLLSSHCNVDNDAREGILTSPLKDFIFFINHLRYYCVTKQAKLKLLSFEKLRSYTPTRYIHIDLMHDVVPIKMHRQSIVL